MSNIGIQKIYGKSLDIPATVGDYTIEFKPRKNSSITDIKYSASAWNNGDNWDLVINGETFFHTIYTKGIDENKHFIKYHDVKIGDSIKVIFHNKSASSKVISIDFGLLEYD